MPITLNKVPRNEAKNPPGLAQVWVAPASSVATIPAPTDMVVATDVTMEATEVFVELELDPEANGVIMVEEPESEGGTGYLYKPDIFLAGNSSALKAAIELIDGVPCVFITKDKGGVMEIYGEADRGIRVRANKEDGTKPGTARGYRLTGNTDFDHLPYDYTGVVPLT